MYDHQSYCRFNGETGKYRRCGRPGALVALGSDRRRYVFSGWQPGDPNVPADDPAWGCREVRGCAGNTAAHESRRCAVDTSCPAFEYASNAFVLSACSAGWATPRRSSSGRESLQSSSSFLLTTIPLIRIRWFEPHCLTKGFGLDARVLTRARAL